VTDDGPQACWIIDTPPLKLKEWMMEIEQGHKLGRLFDLDVQDAEGKTLHREHLGYELRKCLLCDNPAHACGRSRAHSLCELQEAIQEMVCEYVEGNKTIRETIYKAIKQSIIDGKLAVGERIVEKTFADAFRVSRTPVREALRRLETEGHVEYIPRTG
ncbi:Apo-citrate lyase phosphoribosyl-dephospho-CoA transferase like protein, partial [Aduncisulcus paluster]